MKAKVAVKALADALNKVSKAAATRGTHYDTVDSLKYAKIVARDGQLVVGCTNIALALVVRVAADVEREGACAVPAHTTSKLLKELAAGYETVELTFEPGSRHAVFTCGSAIWNVPAVSDDGFPWLPESLDKSELIFSADARAFAGAVKQIGYAAALHDSDDVPLVFQCISVHLNGTGVRMGACDRCRAAITYLQPDDRVPEERHFYLPAEKLAKACALFARAKGQIQFFSESFCEHGVEYDYAILRCGDIAAAVRLVRSEYRFLDAIDKLIYPLNKASGTVTVSRSALAAAMRRVLSVFGKRDNRLGGIATRFEATDGQLSMLVMPPNGATGAKEPSCSEYIDAALTGTFNGMLNALYVLDVAESLACERVVLSAQLGSDKSELSKPVIVRPIDEEGNVRDSYLAIIMPLKR